MWICDAAMPLLRTEVHEGLVCKFYDSGVVMIGTTAADRFTVRLKDGDDFATRLNEELKKLCVETSRDGGGEFPWASTPFFTR